MMIQPSEARERHSEQNSAPERRAQFLVGNGMFELANGVPR
jgi:hypothetical protein